MGFWAARGIAQYQKDLKGSLLLARCFLTSQTKHQWNQCRKSVLVQDFCPTKRLAAGVYLFLLRLEIIPLHYATLTLCNCFIPNPIHATFHFISVSLFFLSHLTNSSRPNSSCHDRYGTAFLRWISPFLNYQRTLV